MPSIWIDTLLDHDIVSGGQVVTDLTVGGTPDIDQRNMTLVRTLVCMDIVPATVNVSSGHQVVDYAIGAGSKEAVSVGIVPDPETATDRPPRGWVYRCRRILVTETLQEKEFIHDEKDLRSKRKLDNGQLYMVMTNTAKEGSAFNISVVGIIRMLFIYT